MFPELPFNWVDWLIVAVIGISVLLSLLRGFVKEALSLVAWVAAFFISTTFAGQVSAVLSQTIDNASLRYGVSYMILFVASLMLGGVVNNLLRQLVKMSGLGGLDRLLGTVFGFARGIIIVVVLTYIGQAVLPKDEFLAEGSVLLPQVLIVVEWAQQNSANLTSGAGLPLQQA